jgi:hypothetical protein
MDQAQGLAHNNHTSSNSRGRPAPAAAGGDGPMPGLTPGEGFVLIWGVQLVCAACWLDVVFLWKVL